MPLPVPAPRSALAVSAQRCLWRLVRLVPRVVRLPPQALQSSQAVPPAI